MLAGGDKYHADLYSTESESMVERDARVWVAQVNCACVVDGSARGKQLCTGKVNRGHFGHRIIPVSIAQKLSLHRAMRI